MKLTTAQATCLFSIATHQRTNPLAMRSCQNGGFLTPDGVITPAGWTALLADRTYGKAARAPALSVVLGRTASRFAALASRDLGDLDADKLRDLSTWLGSIEDALTAIDSELSTK